ALAARVHERRGGVQPSAERGPHSNRRRGELYPRRRSAGAAPDPPVTPAARRSARNALDAARPAVARLDATRGPEDLAADLIEIWTAVETALRSLVGGSALSGQAVIREARQRQLINFDQANALAEFQAVRDRLENHSYRPSEGDVTAARGAFLKLDSALIGEPTGEAPTATTAGGAGAPPAAVAPAPMAGLEALPASGRGVPAWACLLALR